MALMKIVPLVPGHFTIYEWLALGIWIALGVAAASSTIVEERPFRAAYKQ